MISHQALGVRLYARRTRKVTIEVMYEIVRESIILAPGDGNVNVQIQARRRVVPKGVFNVSRNGERFARSNLPFLSVDFVTESTGLNVEMFDLVVVIVIRRCGGR
jgi:hypothetical protein